MKYGFLFLLAVAGCATAQQPSPALGFFAADPEHGAIADSARRIWEADGQRIIGTMERSTGFRFQDRAITVILRAAPSSSGATGDPTSPVRLNVRYPIPMILIHELGHRLNPPQDKFPPDLRTGHRGLDEHKVLYLYLSDVWAELYGAEKADEWRESEREWANLGADFIRTAWDWAMSLGKEGRAAKLREIVAANR